jgi:hypothetical protein
MFDVPRLPGLRDEGCGGKYGSGTAYPVANGHGCIVISMDGDYSVVANGYVSPIKISSNMQAERCFGRARRRKPHIVFDDAVTLCYSRSLR